VHERHTLARSEQSDPPQLVRRYLRPLAAEARECCRVPQR
jgi:hypothetical protein